MFYDRERVEEKLEYGVDDPADMVEDLHEHLVKIIEAYKNKRQDSGVELHNLIKEYDYK